MDQRQQEALKRTFEDAKYHDRCLQEAIENHLRNGIDNELNLLYAAVDVKSSLDSLIKDQHVLYDCLQALKSSEEKTDAIEQKINEIEADMDLRITQINDMSSKLEDLDSKVKRISESFASIPELRTAIIHILNKLLISRDEFTKRLTMTEDRNERLQEENTNLKVRIDELERKKDDKKAVQKKKRINIIESDVEDLDAGLDEAKSCSKDDLRDPDYFPGQSAIPIGRKKQKLKCNCRVNCSLRSCACKKSGAFCSNCKCPDGCGNRESLLKEDADNKELSIILN